MMARKTYKSFIFPETLLDTLDMMDEAGSARFARYIHNYGVRGIEPELEGIEKALWVFMRILIDDMREQEPYTGE
jgi:hypothetical protein